MWSALRVSLSSTLRSSSAPILAPMAVVPNAFPVCARSLTSDARTKNYKMKTKNSAKKRLRVTARGDLKFFPSYLRGDSKRIVKTKAKALEKQMAKLLPNRTRLTRAYRRTGPTMGAMWRPTFAWKGLGDEPISGAKYLDE